MRLLLAFLATAALWACETVSVSSVAPGSPDPHARNVDDPAPSPPDTTARPSVDPEGPAASLCTRPSELPGERLYSATEVGTGECTDRTVASAIAEVHAAFPELQDITTIYDPRGGIGDGSFIYVFLRGDGGFDLVFKRGSGDCPAGCIDNEYWYFETSAECTVQQVGHTHPSEACVPEDEQPRWGTPPSVSPARVCGADNAPQRLPASTLLQACGTRQACDPKAQGTALASVRLDITQDPADLSKGTVTFTQTGDPDLDGQPFAASIARRHVTVSVHTSNLPASCIEQTDLELDFDFEGFGAQHLSFASVHTPDCDAAPNDYCKGGVETDLAFVLD